MTTQTIPSTADWSRPFDVLRRKWSTVPAAARRLSTPELMSLGDGELVELWTAERDAAIGGENYSVRGWYHTLYAPLLRGQAVLDVGSGLGMDGLSFAQTGAHMTLADIVPENLELLARLAGLLGLRGVEFLYIHDLDSLRSLDRRFDVVWAQGSLINAPFDTICAECRELVRVLKIGGRWVELAYPRARWAREGALPFEKWGPKTDGPGTPWMEWYDLDKLLAALAPGQFEAVLYFEFHDQDFNWFDLIRRG